MLSACALDRSYRLVHHPEVGSTNADGLALARHGDPGRLWIVADRQTAGRGRVGKVWDSPSGNLHASLLLVDPCQPRRAPELGFVAGVALAAAIAEITGPEVEIALKWPNDVLHRGAKLAGILVEGTQAPGGFAAVLGFGVNCASHPVDLPYRATSLAALMEPDLPSASIEPSPAEGRDRNSEALVEAGTPTHQRTTQKGGLRDALFAALSTNVTRVLALWAGGRGFAEIRRAWLERALPQGSALAVVRPVGRLTGRFSSIDTDGRLILETDRGLVTVEAGDVFLANGEMTAAS